MNLANSQLIRADGDKVSCKVHGCNKKLVISKMRNHVARHILSMPGGPNIVTCGFCGITGNCSIAIRTNVSKTVIQLSNCPYYSKFSMKTASNVTASNP